MVFSSQLLKDDKRVLETQHDDNEPLQKLSNSQSPVLSNKVRISVVPSGIFQPWNLGCGVQLHLGAPASGVAKGSEEFRGVVVRGLD